MPTRIFVDREKVALAKARAQRDCKNCGDRIVLPLFKIRRDTGILRARSFAIKDKDGNVVARGMTDPSGKVCGATAWVEVPDGVTIEYK